VTVSLAERIQVELIAIQQTVRQTEAFIEQLSAVTDEGLQNALVSAIALNLHAFYTGAERVFSEVAKRVDGSLPAGTEWHKQLLLQMAAPLPGLRAALISEPLLAQLDEFRRFRHVVRSNYAYLLDRDRVLGLAERLQDCYACFQSELEQWLQAPPETVDSE
jgi:hypothetical protein